MFYMPLDMEWNFREIKGLSLFMWACAYGQEDIVQILLNLHAAKMITLDATETHYGFTAIEWASQNGHGDVVKLLLDHSTELSANGKPFILACQKGRIDVVQICLDYSETIDLNAKDKYGWTAFMWTCEKGHEDIATLLISCFEAKGIDLHARDKSGWTALMRASMNGHEGIVRLLVDNGNMSNLQVEAALQWACENGQDNVIEILVNYSISEMIDLNAKDRNGSDAFRWARENGHKVIVTGVTISMLSVILYKIHRYVKN